MSTQPSFDWKTHIRNKKTGKVQVEQHYHYRVTKDSGSYLERDGKKYHPNGQEFGETKPPVAPADTRQQSLSDVVAAPAKRTRQKKTELEGSSEPKGE